MPDADEKRNNWFPAKKYGWGWGFPVCWQGWVVLAVYGVFLLAGAWLIESDRRLLFFILYTIAISAALVAVCWKKGEPARWRWGD